MVGFKNSRRKTLGAHCNQIEGNQNRQGEQAAFDSRKYGGGFAKAN
jgi:hypothetical protein